MPEYKDVLDEMHAIITERLSVNCVVFYSAYDTDEDGLPINNLDEIAIHGEVVMEQPHDPFWGKGMHYYSDLLIDPTWLDIALCADMMIQTTGDSHHIFLEAVNPTDGKSNGVRVYNFCMGS